MQVSALWGLTQREKRGIFVSRYRGFWRFKNKERINHVIWHFLKNFEKIRDSFLCFFIFIINFFDLFDRLHTSSYDFSFRWPSIKDIQYSLHSGPFPLIPPQSGFSLRIFMKIRSSPVLARYPLWIAPLLEFKM